MASATKAPQQRKERARFVALLAKDGLPLVITVKRKREHFDAETGKKQADPDTGVYIRFRDEGNGIQSYESTDPDEIQLLRVRANEHGIYSEVPFPVPPSAPTLKDITALAVRRRKQELIDLALAEEDSHQREDVLEAIADALEQIEG
jgi:hypothetical protein